MSASGWEIFSFLRCLVVLHPPHRLLYPFAPESQSRIIGDLLTSLTQGLEGHPEGNTAEILRLERAGELNVMPDER